MVLVMMLVALVVVMMMRAMSDAFDDDVDAGDGL
jgi:hypothetical protein